MLQARELRVVCTLLFTLVLLAPCCAQSSGLACFAVLVCITVPVALWLMRRSILRLSPNTVAFFHPNAEDGGGGERVLWTAIQALGKSPTSWKIIIFTKAGFSQQMLKLRAHRNFNIQVETPFEVVPLSSVHLLDPVHYPSFTLILQAIGSVRVFWECLHLAVPEILVDTSGWAFIYPLAWLSGCRIGCYVHYPTISVDMLFRVWRGMDLYNNRRSIANSIVLTLMKSVYYELFSVLYGVCGVFATVVMVNSSWTQQHIWRLWWQRRAPSVVYPPVDTLGLQRLPLDRPFKELFLLSIGQFRPEKNHLLQLEAYARALEFAKTTSDSISAHRVLSSKIKIVGSCRNAADQQRLQNLKNRASELHLAEHVIFLENVPYEELKILLANAVAGLHTMLDEHFGISVVEYMAAGVVPIAHDSGGPKMDILNPSTSPELQGQKMGFLESTVEGYAEAIYTVLSMEQSDRLEIAEAARQQASQFSEQRFEDEFIQSIKPLFDAKQR